MKRKSFIASVCLLFALLPLLSAAALPPNETAFASVQRGFVTAGQNVLPYAPNRILVKFKDASLQSSRMMVGLKKGTEVPSATTGIATVDALGQELGVARISRPYVELKNKSEAARLGVERWYMLEMKDGSDVMEAVSRYAADPSVESAQPDYLAFPAVVPTDPLYHDSWGHNNTAQLPGLDWGGTYDHTLSTTVGTPGFDANAEAAWSAAQGFGSSSVVIAIIDTGADIDHPDLTLVTGYDFGDGDSNPDDNSSGGGHGTCCSGVAAAKANNGLGACGIAAGCKVMPLKVANSAGSMYFSAIQNALYYAADNGANIISMSLGAAISSDPATDTAILYAYNAGCVILAATGNENNSTISYPAINANVIGVGAASPCGDRKRSSSLSSECNPGVYTDPNGYTCDGERWWGSNYGTNTANAAGAVDVLAPTILPTTDIQGSGGYRSGDYEPFFNGTSCATPYAAGVCALIKSANPSWTNVQIRTQLVNTAIDIVNVESAAGWDRRAGYGMVDAPRRRWRRRPGGPRCGLHRIADEWHSSSDGDLHRSVERLPDELELDLRRRWHIHRAEPGLHLQLDGNVYGDAHGDERRRFRQRDEDELHHRERVQRAGGGIRRLAHLGRRPAHRDLHRPVDKLPHLMELDLRRRRHIDCEEPLARLLDRRYIHRDAHGRE